MSKILSHTPSWLSRPSPGFDFFQPTSSTKPTSVLSNGKKYEYRGPVRTLATRGTGVFSVVGNEIRWSDLVKLKEEGEEQENRLKQSSARFAGTNGHAGSGGYDAEETEGHYRVLKVPVAGQIRQLVISPESDYMAILTSHTVHVAVLPDVSHLSAPDTSPLRLRTFQLGPTAHVLEQAPVVVALWHPLSKTCLVTVTKDACVRVWELDRNSRHTFDEPALAVDLKKLANATSSSDDLKASKYGTSKGFSPDSVEMEVSSACFGGRGLHDEHGWSAMTLWVAMIDGDIYALCPLVPSKWRATSTIVPSLTTAVVSKASIIREDPAASDEERRVIDQQQQWLADIDAQDPLLDHEDGTELYTRPSHPPAIPKLQGPFMLTPEPGFDEITDILVIGAKIDDDALAQGEETLDDSETEGLSASVICLATDTGKVHVCLDLEGVEAQWLPTKKSPFKRPFEMPDEPAELLIIETIDFGAASDSSYPASFSRILYRNPQDDAISRYSFFLTTATGVHNVSLAPWISHLEDELSGPSESGAGFRMGVILESEKTEVQQIIIFTSENGFDESTPSTCVPLTDSDLGYFVLTGKSNTPYSAVLQMPTVPNIYNSFAPDEVDLPSTEIRQPYQPASAFYTPLTPLPDLSGTRLTRTDLKSQVRFSPATLQLLTDAHRVLSAETNKLGLAAADLFRRCERMRAELTAQIERVNEIATKIDAVSGADDEGAEQPAGEEMQPTVKERIDERITRATEEHESLQQRVERLKRRVAGLGGKELSAREEAWAREIDVLDQSLGESETHDEEAEVGVLKKRLEAAKGLREELLAQVQGLAGGKADEEDASRSLRESSSTSRIPLDFRKRKMEQIWQLLERESALVEGVTERLTRLSAGR